jgi:hypothetical protein
MTYMSRIGPIGPISPIHGITPRPFEHEDEHEHDYSSTAQSSYSPGFTSFT